MKLNAGNFTPETNSSKAAGAGDAVRKLRLICGVLVALLFLLGVRLSGSIRMLSGDIKAQEKEIAGLKAELAEQEKAEDAKAQEPETPEETRASKDSKVSSEFLGKLLTWKDHKQYADIRSWLMKDYQISKDDSLLTSFMPEVDEKTLGDANMKFGSAQTYLLSEKDGLRSYFAFCRVENKTNGNSGEGKVAVSYSIDGDGKVSGISAYALAR